MNCRTPSRMRNIKLVIQYIGTNYVGWQVQPQGESIQGVLQGILSELLHEKIIVTGSGRTDSGVHALAQVAHFKTTHPMDLATIQRALNAKLPWHISILQIEEVDPEFHAQKSAVSKTYSYFILHSDQKIPLLASYSWRIHGELDLEKMEECLKMLIGRHDFNAFKAADSTAKTSVREIQSAEIQLSSLRKQGSIFFNSSPSSPLPLSKRGTQGDFVDNKYANSRPPLKRGMEGDFVNNKVPHLSVKSLPILPFQREAKSGNSLPEEEPYLIVITLQGQGFLKHMVRNIVGTLVEVGQGKTSVEEFKRIFESKDRTQAGKTAPAWGLFLVDVEY